MTWDLQTLCGLVAALLLVATAVYGLRRRMLGTFARRRWGTAKTWLRLHIWGGGLFLLAVGLHAGFTLPDSLLSRALWLLALWTVIAGLLGLAVQRLVPRLLSAAAPVEVNYQRIPELVAEVRQRADQLAEAAEPPVRTLYQRSLAPLLAGPERNLSVLLDAGSRRRHLDPVHRLQRLLPDEQRQRLDELVALVRTKLDLDTHYTLQPVLRGWLWLHAPASTLLLILVVVHVVSMFIY